MIEQPEKLNNEAIILASHGDFKSAIAYFKRALSLEQNNYLLWYNMGLTYRDSGDMDNALHSLEKAYCLEPQNQEVIETLATLYLIKKNFKKSYELCVKGLEDEKTNSHLWNLMGVIEFQQGNFSDASNNFEMAVMINPYYEDALYNLRDTYSELNNTIGASECNKRLKEIRKSFI